MSTKIDQKDISIIQALYKGGLIASLQKISKITGLNKQIIHTRLKKINTNNIIKGFEPKINTSKLGLNYSIISLLELDLNQIKNEETINTFKKISNLDSTISITPLIPNTNYQLLMHEIFEKQEDYYNHLLKLYENHPQLEKIVKERKIYTINNEEENIIKEQNHLNSINQLAKKLEKTRWIVV